MMQILVVIALTACGSTGGTPSPSGSLDVEGSWQLASGRTDAGEVPILEDHPITLTLEGTQIGGRAACNSYGGRVVAGNGGLRLDSLSQTQMACEEPAMAAEFAYMTALGLVREIVRDGEELVARGEGVELRFASLPPPPTAELVDTTWVLETVFVGDVASAPLGSPRRSSCARTERSKARPGAGPSMGPGASAASRSWPPRWSWTRSSAPRTSASRIRTS